MNHEILTSSDLEPLVARIEAIAAVLDALLLAQCSPYQPDPVTFAELGTELRSTPSLWHWLEDRRAAP
jgi:hypothetical protein